MKKCIFLSILAYILLVAGCQYHPQVVKPFSGKPEMTSDETITVAEAQIAFEKFTVSHRTLRQGDAKTPKKHEVKPKWEFSGKVKSRDGKNVIATPLDYAVTDYNHAVLETRNDGRYKAKQLLPFTSRKLITYKEKGKERFEIMSIIAEQEYREKNSVFDADTSFSGMLLFEDYAGNFLRGFYYKDGKQVGQVDTGNNVKGARLAGCYAVTITIVYYQYMIFEGASYPPVATGGSTSYTIFYCDTPRPPDYSTAPPNPLGSGGQTRLPGMDQWSTNQVVMEQTFKQLTFRNVDEKRPIDNKINYFKCFTNTPGSTYKVTVYVDQPLRGSFVAINPFEDHKVGHSFLGFEQSGPTGTVRRSAGFYPKDGGGNKITPSGPSYLNDDSQYDGYWDVGVTFTVSASEFMAMTELVKNYDNQNYNLYNRSCGSMCVDAFRQIGVNLPHEWMESFWFQAPLNPSTYGPSMGTFGEQLKNFNHPKITDRLDGGPSIPSNQGSCN